MTTEGPFKKDRGHTVSMEHLLYKTGLKIRKSLVMLKSEQAPLCFVSEHVGLRGETASLEERRKGSEKRKGRTKTKSKFAGKQVSALETSHG